MKINVLDHGFVRLVDHMGDDSSIVQAARVSYGEGTKSVRCDTGLIRYLMRNQHMSPFEMCELKFHIKLPIFVARQWIRHRTANVNEISARYSVISDDFYVPSVVNYQSKDNKQGSGAEHEHSESFVREISRISYKAYESYKYMIEEGVAREQARIILPVNMYTEWYWKIDLRNLLHFLKLRMDSHAQFEIREYANAIAQVVREHYPVTWSAFNENDTD